MLGAAIKLLRPKQWSKNVFVFAAYLFARQFTSADATVTILLTFVAMSLLSSATYVANDLFDVERDRAHPVKKNRPIASGKVPVPVAIALGLLCLVGGLALAAWIDRGVLILGSVYLALQVVYNLGLKRVPVADVFVVATGFVLRAAVGAAAIDVVISGWLLFCTGALALMLGFGKRRHEWMLQGENRKSSRESLVGYTQRALDAFVIVTATGAAIAYCIYSIESPTAKQFPLLMLSSLFVVYGVARYVLIVFSHDEGGEPESLVVSDRHLIVTFILFAASVLLALSGVNVSFVG